MADYVYKIIFSYYCLVLNEGLAFVWHMGGRQTGKQPLRLIDSMSQEAGWVKRVWGTMNDQLSSKCVCLILNVILWFVYIWFQFSTLPGQSLGTTKRGKLRGRAGCIIPEMQVLEVLEPKVAGWPPKTSKISPWKELQRQKKSMCLIFFYFF